MALSRQTRQYIALGVAQPAPREPDVRLQLASGPELHTRPDVDVLATYDAERWLCDEPFAAGREHRSRGARHATETAPESKLIQGQIAAYRKMDVEPVLWPRLAGSWPGVTFTGPPLRLPAGMFGMGNGGGAHAPDEYFLIEAENPDVASWDDVVRSYVELFRSLA